MGMLTEVSTRQVLSFMGSPSVKIIDIRPVDSYNGWKLAGEQRGGHIPGSRSLPLKWFSYLDWIEIVRRKEIYPANKIIIYGYSLEDIVEASKRFLDSGYADVHIYPGFVTEWIPAAGLPLDNLDRFRQLVHPAWVNEIINGRKPDEYDNDSYVLVHAHYRNRDAYLSGHIPGAIDIDTLAIEAPETWNRRPPSELKAALQDHGITSGTTVVLYGKYMHPDKNDPFPGSSAGDIGAMRCAWIMMYAGVRDVRVLNGGFQSWLDAGYEFSFNDVKKNPADDFGASVPVHPELAVDTPGAKEMLKSETAALVCVRSWPEYIGEVSGYNYIEAKGRIPGAVFADCGSDAYHMENYRNLDLTTREYGEISAIWTRSGITPDKHLAFYCGTGWRGSEAWFNAWLMGWPRVSVYDGGWFEWSNDPGNPYETGIPGGKNQREKITEAWHE